MRGKPEDEEHQKSALHSPSGCHDSREVPLICIRVAGCPRTAATSRSRRHRRNRGERRGRMDDEGQDYEGKREPGGGKGRTLLARMKRQDHRWPRKRSEVARAKDAMDERRRGGSWPSREGRGNKGERARKSGWREPTRMEKSSVRPVQVHRKDEWKRRAENSPHQDPYTPPQRPRTPSTSQSAENCAHKRALSGVASRTGNGGGSTHQRANEEVELLEKEKRAAAGGWWGGTESHACRSRPSIIAGARTLAQHTSRRFERHVPRKTDGCLGYETRSQEGVMRIHCHDPAHGAYDKSGRALSWMRVDEETRMRAHSELGQLERRMGAY
ncbi:hypothetical protein FB451DRAFT_1173193 [Mycena latifolia]|nr:hypothetical protein FB451DRAFT_1173193 [Mycena latifolia]